MALQTEAYSPKKWKMAFSLDSTVGKAGTTSQTLLGLEVSSVSYPTLGDTRVLEQRSGSSGRVLNTGDLLNIRPGAVHEWSFSGIPMTQENAELLISNALGVAVSSHQFTLATGYEHAAFSFGVGAESAAASKTLSFYLTGSTPDSNVDSYVLGGCVITSMTLNANANENGGRWMMDFSVQSRSPFTEAAAAAISIDTAYTSNYVYLGEATQTVKVHDADVYLDTISVTIDNPVAFHGNYFDGTDHYPEAYQRAIPNLNISANASVKYDSNVEALFNRMRDLTVSSNGLFLSNNANIDSADKFCIDIPSMIIEELTLDEGDYMKLNVGMKMVDGGTDLINVVTGGW